MFAKRPVAVSLVIYTAVAAFLACKKLAMHRAARSGSGNNSVVRRSVRK